MFPLRGGGPRAGEGKGHRTPSAAATCLLSASQKLLFERGKESLESEFRSLMTRHSKVVSPVLILDLISGDDELEVQEDVLLEHLPESVLRDVVRISRWLVEYGRNQGESPPPLPRPEPLPSHAPSCLLFFETGSHYKALVVLELCVNQASHKPTDHTFSPPPPQNWNSECSLPHPAAAHTF